MTNAGKKHKPVGISKRTDKRAAARSIRARSSLSSCSTAASISTPGESPCNQAGSKDSRIMPSAMSPAPPSVSPCCPDRPRRFAPPKRAEWFIPAEASVPAKAAHHASDHETPRNNDSPTRQALTVCASNSAAHNIKGPRNRGSLPQRHLHHPQHQHGPCRIGNHNRLVMIRPLPNVRQTTGCTRLHHAQPACERRAPRCNACSNHLRLTPIAVSRLASGRASKPDRPHSSIRPTPNTLGRVENRTRTARGELPSIPPTQPRLPATR